MVKVLTTGAACVLGFSKIFSPFTLLGMGGYPTLFRGRKPKVARKLHHWLSNSRFPARHWLSDNIFSSDAMPWMTFTYHPLIYTTDEQTQDTTSYNVENFTQVLINAINTAYTKHLPGKGILSLRENWQRFGRGSI